jgi:hypothetical protein
MRSFRFIVVFAILATFVIAAEIGGWLQDFTLPGFSKEGYRTMTVRGAEARYNGNQVDVVGLNATTFSGDAANTVDGVLLSPTAVFLPKERVMHGAQSVRFISFNPRDSSEAEIEASGTRWAYHHANRRILLDGDVRVVFRAELKDLLK